ncbi:hypothetical protein J3458_001039 [Metarhizium acridum]|uniref:uncharacterized protein n=1 Tax=Metarhizium acridum TaxID=92637 RepID=UPI001C6D2205|nr:hypothetical protein J3458_001039 [Metarhizium acridum]
MDAPPNSSVAGGEKAFIIQPSELTPSRANVGNHGNGVNAQHFKVAQDPIRCDSCDCEERCLNLGRRHDGTSMDVNEGDGFGMEESTMAENQLPSALLGRVLIRVASRSSYDPGASPSWWLPGLDSMLCWSSRHLQYMVCHAYTRSQQTRMIVVLCELLLLPHFQMYRFTIRHVLADFLRSVSQLKGLDQLLWHFPDILHSTFAQGPERRVMDRLNQYLSHLLRGHSHRPSRGCGLFPRRFLARYCSCWACGHGCLSCPALAVLSTYFLCRRALALGIAACGSVTGGLVFPSMVRQMLPSTGLPWTVRTIAFVQLATMILANLLARSRIKRRKAGPLVEWSAFKELEYTFYAAGAFFNIWGAYFAFFYVAAFSRDALRPPLSYQESLNMLLILNGVGAIGRVVPNT